MLTDVADHQLEERTNVMSRERTIAGPRYNRWLAPPAALAIHLCIGMAYGFSVFWLPMSHLLPASPATSCATQGFIAELLSTTCNWSVPTLTHVFETFIAVLGISAAIWGGWLEHAGPRKAGFISALCWGGGLIIGGVGVAIRPSRRSASRPWRRRSWIDGHFLPVRPVEEALRQWRYYFGQRLPSGGAVSLEALEVSRRPLGPIVRGRDRDSSKDPASHLKPEPEARKIRSVRRRDNVGR